MAVIDQLSPHDGDGGHVLGESVWVALDASCAVVGLCLDLEADQLWAYVPGEPARLVEMELPAPAPHGFVWMTEVRETIAPLN